ncbi:hypothetical protein VDG1235_4750 [Verrucomicrobiia bacterium DG1235]|nr:hypothetical protein VDG1235_4750 [Verrucomicrobiae bacterium DG1235]
MDKAVSGLGVRLSAAFVKSRRAFFKMTMREKVLVLLFAFALLFVWFSWQLDRHALLGAGHNTARIAESNQKLELDDGPNVRATYESQKSEIDLTSLPTKDEASGLIDALVRRSGFSSFDLGQPRTEEGAEMNFHTFQLVVQKASYPKIKSFTERVKAELPFLSLERIVIQAQARDDSFVDVRYVFKSIEYTK